VDEAIVDEPASTKPSFFNANKKNASQGFKGDSHDFGAKPKAQKKERDL